MCDTRKHDKGGNKSGNINEGRFHRMYTFIEDETKL